MNLRRPQTGEYGEFYQGYIDQIDGPDFMPVLRDMQLIEWLESIPEDKWEYRYAPDKWTIKEMILHIIDTERVFTYRALRVARKDKTAMAGFDQDLFVPHSMANERTPASLINEFWSVRLATLALYETFRPEVYDAIGTASDAPISVRALGFITAGHFVHHINILKERYLS